LTRSTGSSSRWRQRQEKDLYVERAAREGWRSRAVFKLEQIQARERILKRGMICVDLGASPGSWSQFAARRVGPTGTVLALDVLPMDTIPGVQFVQGDFSNAEAIRNLLELLGDRRADLVMSDMAPNISGNRTIDQPRSMLLAEDGLMFAEQILAEGGTFLVKLFQGEGFEHFVSSVRPRFRRTRLVKPKASRPASREIYLLARHYRMV